MTEETKSPDTPNAAPEKPAGGKAEGGKPAAAPPKAPPGPKKWEPTGTVVENDVTAALKEAFGQAVQGVPSPCGEAAVLVETGVLLDVLRFLRDDPRTAMNYLSDLTAAHYPANDRKFEVLYHLFSLEKKHALRVKVRLDEGESCPSATSVWPGADWMEREAHDMFGIVFEGHPNLEVILLPEDFEGHPLRKEYPLGGDQEEMIRGNRYGKPVYLPDDLEEARKILEEERHGR